MKKITHTKTLVYTGIVASFTVIKADATFIWYGWELICVYFPSQIVLDFKGHSSGAEKKRNCLFIIEWGKQHVNKHTKSTHKASFQFELSDTVPIEMLIIVSILVIPAWKWPDIHTNPSHLFCFPPNVQGEKCSSPNIWIDGILNQV